ncbi:DUF5753 domain-containing protein [Saccharopolyspora sp. NFXS83]|uniref:DUF5753 domain-containing protein n=1 Tax=Saccharopolyspora sp. NFXS83 TaxID=2993560 RepID=UPI002B05986E|nr:DUF5753 domain-containing protein [Saccharopolyspora sp. NFXS83]
MAREADAPDWIRPGIPGVRDELVTLIEYERTATEIVEVAPLLIPGLLRTSDCSRAVMGDLPTGEREAKAGMRAVSVICWTSATAFEAITAEQVLSDQVCGAEEQADQLRHLVKAAEKTTVSIRILAADLRRWTPMRGGHFMFFGFPQAAPIVHVEMPASGVFISRPSTIDAYRQAVGAQRRETMSEEQAVDLISSRIERLEGWGSWTFRCRGGGSPPAPASRPRASKSCGSPTVRDGKDRAAGHMLASTAQRVSFVASAEDGRFDA